MGVRESESGRPGQLVTLIGGGIHAAADLMNDIYEPVGTRFYDLAGKRSMMLVSNDEPREDMRGWLLWRHPDGQWVTLRKATADDLSRLHKTFPQDVQQCHLLIMSLEQDVERLKAHITRLEKMLEDHAVDGKGLAILAHLETAASK